MKASDRLPTIYLPHGGGPWNVMMDELGEGSGYPELAAWLKTMGDRYRGRLKSILAISAHWEEKKPTIHFGAKPGMLYDYGGFPEHTYKLSWPAPGDPALAARIEGLLEATGIKTARETERGYDHGTFVPLMVAFPDATIPVAQLSLVSGLDPQTHYAIGAALTPLREEGVLIIGSGMSYHNMRGFMSGSPRVEEDSRLFDDWLAEAVGLADPDQRRKRLAAWEAAPRARDCHPRSEHLVPLFVAAGAAAEDPGQRDYSGSLMGVRISGHVFGH